jgi:hypothetical protein
MRNDHVLLTQTLVGASGQLHAPAALGPRSTEGWVNSRAGLARCGKGKVLDLIGTRTLDPPSRQARSQPLYLLRYNWTLNLNLSVGSYNDHTLLGFRYGFSKEVARTRPYEMREASSRNTMALCAEFKARKRICCYIPAPIKQQAWWLPEHWPRLTWQMTTSRDSAVHVPLGATGRTGQLLPKDAERTTMRIHIRQSSYMFAMPHLIYSCTYGRAFQPSG